MSDSADTPGDSNPSGDVPDDHTASAQTPREADINTSTSANETHHISYTPPPATRSETKRQQRALRRMYHQRNAHPWVKKIPWILFPTYGFMRMHDPDYEQHYEQWKDQQRRNYGERDS